MSGVQVIETSANFDIEIINKAQKFFYSGVKLQDAEELKNLDKLTKKDNLIFIRTINGAPEILVVKSTLAKAAFGDLLPEKFGLQLNGQLLSQDPSFQKRLIQNNYLIGRYFFSLPARDDVSTNALVRDIKHLGDAIDSALDGDHKVSTATSPLVKANIYLADVFGPAAKENVFFVGVTGLAEDQLDWLALVSRPKGKLLKASEALQFVHFFTLPIEAVENKTDLVEITKFNQYLNGTL